MDIARRDNAKRRRVRWWLTGAGVTAGLAGVASLSALEPAVLAVDRSGLLTGTVERGEFLCTVRGPGTLVPKELRWIAAQTAARVDHIVIKPGATVSADAVILELSNPVVDDALASARAAVVAARSGLVARRTELETQLLDARSNLVRADADYQVARAEVEAQASVAAAGGMPKVQFRRSQITEQSMQSRLEIERLRLAMFQRNLRAQLAAEEARLDQSLAALALAQRQSDALRVRAGIAGVLQTVPVEEGQQVQVGANLARVARPDALRADIRIAETQAKDVAIGQPAKVDTRNGVVAGRVSRIDPSVTNGMVKVEVEFDGPLPSGARPDLSVDAVLEVDRVADALFVPRPTAAQPRSHMRLFRVDREGEYASSVPVHLGRASATSIEVLSGLQQGDVILLSEASAHGDRQRIRFK